MDELRGYCPRWNKPSKERSILHELTCKCNL
jgi:hypothetical protein